MLGIESRCGLIPAGKHSIMGEGNYFFCLPEAVMARCPLALQICQRHKAFYKKCIYLLRIVSYIPLDKQKSDYKGTTKQAINKPIRVPGNKETGREPTA